MNKTVTATFQIFQPITLVAETEQQVDEISEMFFANGALTVSVRNEGVV
jgi:hypothetical protein